MFSGWMDKLWPVNDVMTALTKNMYLDPETYSYDDTVKTIKEKEEVMISNVSSSTEQINKLFPIDSKIEFKKINYGSIYLRFTKKYMTESTILKMNNIIIDIAPKESMLNVINDDSNPETQTPTEEGGFAMTMVMKVLNMVVKNFEFEATKIKIRFIVGDKVYFCLMIKKISFDKSEKPKEIAPKNKSKYLFCHNKEVIIDGILLKEGYSEEDEIYYADENENKVRFYTQKDILLLMNEKIILFCEHDYEKQILTISNETSYMNVQIESIFTKDQIKKLFEIKSIFDNIYIPYQQKKAQEVPSEQSSNTEEKKEIDILGFKVKEIAFSCKVSYLYFIIVDNASKSENENSSKPKFWLIYQKYFAKYYEGIAGISSNSVISLLQRHFCYYEEVFYFAYLNTIAIEYNSLSSPSIIVTDIAMKMIQPNKIENKKKIIIITNSLNPNPSSNNNNSSLSSNETSFNEAFMNYYIKIVNFNFFAIDLIQVSKANVQLNRISIDAIAIEVNAVVIERIKTLFASMNISKKSAPVAMASNSNENLSSHFEFCVTNLSIKAVANKKALRYLKSDLCIDNDVYSESIVISVYNMILKSEVMKDKKNISFAYDKISFWFMEANIAYPFIVNYKSESDEYAINGMIIPEINIDVKIGKIIFFANPFLMQNLFIFIKLFSLSFLMFSNAEVNSSNDNTNVDYFALVARWIKSLNIEDIRVILFANVSMKNNRFDLRKINAKNDLVFKFILNPILKLQMQNLTFDVLHRTILIKQLFALIRKQDNIFHNENLLYQNFIIDNANKCFEYVLYDTRDTKNATNNLVIELKRTNEIDIKIENILFCLLTKSFDEIYSLLEHAKREYSKMASTIQVKFPNANQLIELATFNQKLSSNKENSDANKNCSSFSISFNMLYIDIFSSHQAKKNFNMKKSSRLTSQISQFAFSHCPSATKIEINSINSLLISDMTFSSKANDELNDISNNFASFTSKGFAEIAKVSSLSLESSQNFATNKFRIQSIELHFCKDSLSCLVECCDKIKVDIKNVINVYNAIEDDKESIVTDIVQEKFLKDQLRNRGLNQSGFEFRTIGKARSDNAKLHKFNLKNAKPSSVNSGSQNSGKNNVNHKNSNNNVITQTVIEKENEDTSATFTNDKFFFFIDIGVINANLHKGDDFNFSGEYNIDIDTNTSSIDRVNMRSSNEMLTAMIKAVHVKLIHDRKSQMVFSLYSNIQNVIVYDKLLNSKYKVLLSRYNFEDESEIFFAMKADILRSPNGNGESDINAILDISSCSICLDQSTLEFVLSFLPNSNIIAPPSETFYSVQSNDIANTENEISQMNYSQYKANLFNLNMSLNPDSFYISKFIITEFFVCFTYNAREFSYDKMKSQSEPLKYLEMLNLMSVSEMGINFKEFNCDYMNKVKRIKAKKIIEELIEFYKNDIVENQAVASYMRSMPVIKGVCNVMDGVSDMVCFPYDSYKRDIPVEIGMVNGVRSFVKNTTCELLSLAEKTGNVIQKLAFWNRSTESDVNVFRKLKYIIDEEEKKKDEYYSK